MHDRAEQPATETALMQRLGIKPYGVFVTPTTSLIWFIRGRYHSPVASDYIPRTDAGENFRRVGASASSRAWCFQRDEWLGFEESAALQALFCSHYWFGYPVEGDDGSIHICACLRLPPYWSTGVVRKLGGEETHGSYAWVYVSGLLINY